MPAKLFSKGSLHLFILGVVFISLPYNVTAQSDSRPDRTYRIVASRFGQDVFYSPGTRLCIKYKRGDSEIKERGFFAGALDNKIILTPDKVGSYRIAIPPEDIIYIRKIKPLNRIIAGSAGLAMITSGILIFESISNTSPTMGVALLAYPLIVGGMAFLFYYIPSSLILEKINEKKRSKGWDFQLSNK